MESKEELAEDVIVDPQVTSSDPNERKVARKLRIERRLEALKKAIQRQNIPEGEDTEQVVKANKTLLETQLQKSAEAIEKLLLESDELITNIRVANDSREVDRREAEGIGRIKVIEKLEEEAIAAQEAFDEIANKWMGILKHNDPLQINDELITQREKCDELVCQKDGVIAMLKEELTIADKKFTEDQWKQTDDIHCLAKRIEKQVTLVRRAYRQELHFIEDVVMIERQMTIDGNDKKWEELYRKRDLEEVANCERKFQMLEEFDEEITKVRVEHQERFRESKIKLEHDVEALQREFEQIKATALINSEKMDYNYQILRKREDENIIIKSQQKRRINKLQDVVVDLRRKIREYQENTAHEMVKLTDEVGKLQKCVLEQENKAESMSHTNDTKYRQVWELNTKRAKGLLDKILTIDQLIYEQQLGMEWRKPVKELFEKEALPSYRMAVQAVQEMRSESTVYNKKKSEEQGSSKQTSSSPPSSHDQNSNYKKLLSNVLEQISAKSGFLVEYRLKYILDPYTQREHVLVRIDNVFAALGIKQKDELDSIIDFFLPYAYCPLCTKATTPAMKVIQNIVIKSTHEFNDKSSLSIAESSDEEDESTESETTNILGDILNAVRQPDYVIEDIVNNIVYPPSLENILSEVATSSDVTLSSSELSDEEDDNRPVPIQGSKRSSVTFRLTCKHRHPLVINDVYVLRALREFLTNHFTDTINSSVLNKKRVTTISRQITDVDVEDFWHRFKVIFSEGKEKLWDGLLTGFQKYHAILLDRQKLYEEVLQLRKRNKELKCLYNQYKIGKEINPPCAAQRVQEYKTSPAHGSKRHSCKK